VRLKAVRKVAVLAPRHAKKKGRSASSKKLMSGNTNYYKPNRQQIKRQLFLNAFCCIAFGMCFSASGVHKSQTPKNKFSPKRMSTKIYKKQTYKKNNPMLIFF
jgi:hypothetical protein